MIRTKVEHAQYNWNKKMNNIRNKAVDDFWEKEIIRISEGKSTRPWTTEQVARIQAGKKPQFNGQSLHGHHSYSVSRFPHLAGKHEGIWPASFKEHLYGWHGGNWKTSLPSKPINVNEVNEIFLGQISLR